jgi:hypothetical protein
MKFMESDSLFILQGLVMSSLGARPQNESGKIGFETSDLCSRILHHDTARMTA